MNSEPRKSGENGVDDFHGTQCPEGMSIHTESPAPMSDPSDGAAHLDDRSTASRLLRWLERVALFGIGAMVIWSLYHGDGAKTGKDPGVPGHDSFYHIKMAEMLPEHGFMREFPWLQFSYFTQQGHGFVSHHSGFHVILAPFVYLAKLTTGDALAGGRWAMCFFAGLNLVLFHALLDAGGVRCRWLFVALLVVLPDQFLVRHAYVRAIGPSLLFMQLLLLVLIHHRFVLVAIVAFLYVQLYLGAALYVPVIVAAYTFSGVCGPKSDRELPWKTTIAAVLGWGAGIYFHPYSGAVYEFLMLQVFGSGLSPDISVGREWKPYQNVWWFSTYLAGPLLLFWTLALVSRLRFGPLLRGRELTVLVLSLMFLVLTLKARRFIEYWPAFCVLSTAYLLSPFTRTLAFRKRIDAAPGLEGSPDISAGSTVLSGILAGAIFCVVVTQSQVLTPLYSIPIAVAAVLFVALPAVRLWLQAKQSNVPAFRRSVRMFSAFTILLLIMLSLRGQSLKAAQRASRCGYDLPAIQKMMEFIQADSKPGDVIFTDDWDIFPVYFYYNAQNHYVVGLDPKFTHERRPDLWERYVRITRGDIPSDAELEEHIDDGTRLREKIHVELSDIRDQFGAGYVITDRDHKKLARKLSRDSELAQLVYPSASYSDSRNEPYLVFKILDRKIPENP